MDHQDWGDWGGGDGDDGDYSGDAETADLGDPDEPIASGLGGYEDHGGYPAHDAGDQGYGVDQPDPGQHGSGGFLEDDPMGAFGDHGSDTGPGADHDPGAGHGGADGGDEPGDEPGDEAGDEPGHGYLSDAGDHDAPDYGADHDPGHDPDADGDSGTDVPPDTADHTADDASGDPHPETVVGADPDVDPDADWDPADFPDQLDFTAPEPVDGYPWSDPSAVAAPGTGGEDLSHGPDAAPPAEDLLDYAGAEGGGDPWAALVGSDDPAASSLGRWWAPGT